MWNEKLSEILMYARVRLGKFVLNYLNFFALNISSTCKIDKRF